MILKELNLTLSLNNVDKFIYSQHYLKIMNKKGQVTLFVIIAIIFIGGVALFFIFREGIEKKDVFTPEIENVKSFVEECVREVGEEAVYFIGVGGGYFFPPELATSEGIPYYYIDGGNKMPSKENVEKEISSYVDRSLISCTKNFEDFKELNIEQKTIKTKAKIDNEIITLSIISPISVTKADTTSIIDNFENIEIPVRMGIVYNSIQEIMEEAGKDGICMSCILEIDIKNDLETELWDYDENTVVFVVTDENSNINNETFIWIFANKYEIQ